MMVTLALLLAAHQKGNRGIHRAYLPDSPNTLAGTCGTVDAPSSVSHLDGRQARCNGGHRERGAAF